MVDPTRILSLCSGIGGLDLGVGRAIHSRVVAYVERDAYAAATLIANMGRVEGTPLDCAPIWVGDLRDLDPAPMRGHIDMVLGGFPCPPFSVAGKQLGAKDERDLWPEVLRIIRGVGARYVFLENVRGAIRHRDGLGRWLGNLAELGLDAEYAIVRASDVGSPQRRERLFVLGYSDGARLQGWDKPQQQGSNELPAWPPSPEGDWSSIPRGLWPATSQPCFRRVDDAGQSPDRVDPHRDRTDRLRCLGNAVCPSQGLYAFRLLARRAGLI